MQTVNSLRINEHRRVVMLERLAKMGSQGMLTYPPDDPEWFSAVLRGLNMDRLVYSMPVNGSVCLRWFISKEGRAKLAKVKR